MYTYTLAHTRGDSYVTTDDDKSEEGSDAVYGSEVWDRVYIHIFNIYIYIYIYFQYCELYIHFQYIIYIYIYIYIYIQLTGLEMYCR